MEFSKRKAVLAAAALVAGLLCGVAVAGNPHGTPPGQQTTSSSSAGVKPSNNTQKDQTCTTGGGQGSSASCQSGTYTGKQDSSKRYGNGKTAAQIANGKGAPAGTPIYGPGNSQPHKICGRDVHAYKGANDKKCPSGTTSGTSSTSGANTASSRANTASSTAATGNTASGTAGTGTSARSSSNPSANGAVLGSSHTLSKPVTSGAKPAHAAPGTATFTG